MNVILEFSVVPIGVGTSLSKYVAACERVLAETDLHYELHANGTNVEGEWDAVFAAVKRCHEVLHQMGVPRISTLIKVGTRSDREQTMQGMVMSVEDKLETDGKQ
ncbi:MAG: MTH1187 family thiamine-binding protein [Chloroflexota bacterium]